MIKILGNRFTGKTAKLLSLAKENNAIIVCKNTDHMRDRAYKYGLTGIMLVSYVDYINYLSNKVIDFNIDNRPVYIDDMSEFIKEIDNNISGYTEAID